MIISHRHRFIFLKTRKTAGTSIEIALSRFCGPDDVITPIVAEDEALRRELGFRGPQNTALPEQHRHLAGRLQARVLGKPYAFFNHAPAPFVRSHLDPEIWDGYFKFCFERNPYDKAISRYFWSTRESASPPPIARYLRGAKRHQISNWDVYTEKGRIAVDFVGRFEHLAEDLQRALAQVGVSAPLPLPRTKTRYRRDARHYSEVLDARSRARIERVCARELAAFDYRWVDADPSPLLLRSARPFEEQTSAVESAAG